jgi:hypothetical protein
MAVYPEEQLRSMASRWMPDLKNARQLRVHTVADDYFKVEYGDIVLLKNRPYLIRQSAKEGRFGLDDEVKHWVKYAIDLENDSRCIIKLVFHEKFACRIGGIEFDCFRSPAKEARILELVQGHRNFMQGFAVTNGRDNVVRILQVIHGKTLPAMVDAVQSDHETYFYRHFPEILQNFMECISAIRFLHDHGQKHGDIRRDHILIDRDNSAYRWIDFDYNYRHRENIFGYDLFGLGNILIYLVGKGDVLLQQLKNADHPAFSDIRQEDVNIVFHNRIANLKKVYPYIPEALNRVLLHFSNGANRFYDHTNQLLEDLSAWADIQPQPPKGAS